MLFMSMCLYAFLIDFYWVKTSHFTETKIYVKLTLMLQTLHTLLSWYALRYQPTPLKNTAPFFFAKSTLKSVNCPNSPFLGNTPYINFFSWIPHLKIGFFIGPTALKLFVLNPISSLKSNLILSYQFKFFVITEKNSFVCKLFLTLPSFYVKTVTLWKRSPSLSQQLPRKIEILLSPSFSKFGRRFTPPQQKLGFILCLSSKLNLDWII